jgi:four helix bundle protein
LAAGCGLGPFAREVVGRQLARAADSVGANIAEASGRFHYGEKLQFLYYARGSLFETKYWVNRALERGMMTSERVQDYASRLTSLTRQLNSFAGSLKAQHQGSQARLKAVRETAMEYETHSTHEMFIPFFNETDLEWLQTVPICDDQSPISSL